MNKIERLVKHCKGSVSITFNDHTTNYSTVEKELEYNHFNRYDDVPEDVKAEMVKRDTMVEIQFYTDTPVGFYLIVHYDLDKALDEALKIVDERESNG